MAAEFPHVDFVSLDMIPLVPHTPRANITFEVYDVYNGFAELDASFDIIRNYHAFLREVDRVLKPGGLLLFGQLEVEVYEYNPPRTIEMNAPLPHPDPVPPTQIIPAHQILPIMCRGMSMLRDSLTTQNCCVYMWRDLPELLLPNSILWQTPTSDLLKPTVTPLPMPQYGSNGIFPPPPRSQAQRLGYTSIQSEIHVLPTAPWHTSSPRLYAIGDLVRQIGVANWQHFGLLFRQHGLSEAEADRLVEQGLAELASKERRTVMRYHTVHATKI
ncbi:hypothetical protein FRC07_007305 [Ceratobasidium sp. 392]|nr:hypothetical protein FRC07_007305 [Ceratobasidium sp. 392]